MAKKRFVAGEEAERTLLSAADRRSRSVVIGFGLIRVVTTLALVLVSLGPLFWLFKAATSTSQDILREPLGLWKNGFHGDNIAQAWSVVRISQYFGNTVMVAVGSLVATLVVTICSAYVISVLRPWWAPIFSGAILATLFIPSVVSLIPLYLTIIDVPGFGISLMNTFWAVWLPSAANAFLIMVVIRFFDGLPAELFEAARIDGANSLRVLWSVVLPLSRPVIGVVALLTVMASWKEYLWPLLVLTDPALQPLSVALPRISESAELSIEMAALFITVAIPVALFLLFQRQFLSGVASSGGIKG